MFNILLVDDEMPTLRFVQAIIDKYLPDFTVACKFQSAVEALEAVKTRRDIDLMITDISMPCMSGIELAMQSRTLRPDMRTVIISGYADFEYAKAAINAGVDDYLLKPINVSAMVETLGKVAEKLAQARQKQQAEILNSLVLGKPYDRRIAQRLFSDSAFCFAFVRTENLSSPILEKLFAVSLVPSPDQDMIQLTARDDSEAFLLLGGKLDANGLAARIEAYFNSRPGSPTETAVYDKNPKPITALTDFVRRALPAMQDAVIIGQRHMVSLTGAAPQRTSAPLISGATLKKIDHFITSFSAPMLKDIFISLAGAWETQKLPQHKVSAAVRLLLQQAFLSSSVLHDRQEEIWVSVDDLFHYASSYGDLMSGLYALLFDESSTHDKNLSADGLYSLAIAYIDKNYMQPLSVQSVCQEIGVSQTYLSRLFRKYGDCTFNTYLTKCRMDAAVQLMKEHHDILLRDVAACVGYDDPSYFSKVFHQAMHISPTEYLLKLNA